MKGYLTVFLSLSLSILSGFILLLTGSGIRNAGKIRLECAVDTGMNAILSEFHTFLFERYGLLYVDASYLKNQPSAANVENRIRYYTEKNTSRVLGEKNAPWGNLTIEKAVILSFETAAADKGASMRNQAICYAEDKELSGEERQAVWQIEEITSLDREDPMRGWIGIMEHLAGMELPRIQNEKGIWEEVPLSNPADWVYSLAGSDILYLARIETEYISPARISLQDYISHRAAENIRGEERRYREEQDVFLSYLFDRMGYYNHPREESLLSCQLEYLAYGRESDLENMRETAARLLRWRFSDNAARALADGDLRAQALAAADLLLVVTLNPAFREPVAESILYACAFLESVGDVRTLYEGGRIPVRKTAHQMSVAHILGGNIYHTSGGDGWSYGQYLAGMILLANQEIINLRSMDIMEMDIRFHDGNRNFSMDWCMERIAAEITGSNGWGDHYFIRRKYGYF